ncbi:LodA/GoxA family CTQ-dependent oxidase [Vibrio sp. VPAP30]|uniref:LodA/GoxA family CTQ-dependent oxidase n=1 Tax=Vibrio sp. VPAP30 TaxID=1647102 RepID=UPI000657CB5B|nr:LodA/GoxA family CTQ-dependent oxidase [Vibrio sp. VPAP30]KLN63993.1 hypothetical protein ZX61_17845 [Vibrio sp. VPAP30]
MGYFRVHPSINFARVGNSKEYYLAPETAAGEIIDKDTGLFGGLPIKAGSEFTPIDESDFRDKDGNVKRQAARFRLFAYDNDQTTYPSNDTGREVKIGDTIGGKVIKDIVWQVHVANKKNNNFKITSDNGTPEGAEEGIVAYQNGKTPPIRNAEFGAELQDINRLKALVVDPGPRAISVKKHPETTLHFDQATPASFVNLNNQIQQESSTWRYPKSFPDQNFNDEAYKMFNPLGAITSLGEMCIEQDTGRLIVTGGYGKASGIIRNGEYPALSDAIDNDYWFDDTSDGPVTATVYFEDDTVEQAVHGWVVCTDPSYAPQTRNVVSTWDDVYDTWVQNLSLQPAMFDKGFNQSYLASFNDDVIPVFHAAFLQQWNAAIPEHGIQGHNRMKEIQPSDKPSEKIPSFTSLLRKPSPPGTTNSPDNEDGTRLKMPLALGDAMKSFLAVTETQYFLLMQWYGDKYEEKARPMGNGEQLDKVVLENCLGGRYSPGIDLTFIVRDTNLYMTNWQGKVGPFRINMEALDYANAKSIKPFLGVGYIPLRTAAVEPGDLSKFMAQPWHTDYNSCATHVPDPNPSMPNPDGKEKPPIEDSTLYWSWPAQRPVSVYPKFLFTYNQASGQGKGVSLFSVRGDEGNGTKTFYAQQQGRYQCYFDFIENWHKIGFVIQGLQIRDDESGTNFGPNYFLEVESQFTSRGDGVEVWPQASEPGYEAPSNCGPK